MCVSALFEGSGKDYILPVTLHVRLLQIDVTISNLASVAGVWMGGRVASRGGLSGGARHGGCRKRGVEFRGVCVKAAVGRLGVRLSGVGIRLS